IFLASDGVHGQEVHGGRLVEIQTLVKQYDAVVVGSGPNGLAAAIRLAQAGKRVVVYEANSTIGGGSRSAEITRGGFIHDTCSSIHPLAVGSAYFRSRRHNQYGLEWLHA